MKEYYPSQFNSKYVSMLDKSVEITIAKKHWGIHEETNFEEIFHYELNGENPIPYHNQIFEIRPSPYIKDVEKGSLQLKYIHVIAKTKKSRSLFRGDKMAEWWQKAPSRKRITDMYDGYFIVAYFILREPMQDTFVMSPFFFTDGVMWYYDQQQGRYVLVNEFVYNLVGKLNEGKVDMGEVIRRLGFAYPLVVSINENVIPTVMCILMLSCLGKFRPDLHYKIIDPIKKEKSSVMTRKGRRKKDRRIKRRVIRAERTVNVYREQPESSGNHTEPEYQVEVSKHTRRLHYCEQCEGFIPRSMLDQTLCHHCDKQLEVFRREISIPRSLKYGYKPVNPDRIAQILV